MQKRNLIGVIGDWSADPIDAPICMKIIDAIDNNTPMGRMIMRIVEYAEAGEFR